MLIAPADSISDLDRSVTSATGEPTAESPDPRASDVLEPVEFSVTAAPDNSKTVLATELVDGSAVQAVQSVSPIPDPPAPQEFLDEKDGLEVQRITLDSVIFSIHRDFPLLEYAAFQRNIANGDYTAASGEFDTKLKGSSENGPLGFYETYRQSIGVSQPLIGGGEAFAGYRIGRGYYQPWYLERQTNDGGELKAGVQVPLLRDNPIDARRAELWKTAHGRQLVEADIRAQLIGFVQEGSYSYWDWVAAGMLYEISINILKLAEERTERIRDQVEQHLIDPPELTDNLRLVADRRAKLAEADRKLRQKAAKLSLYYRDDLGRPSVPTREQIVPFPVPQPVDVGTLPSEISLALANRPELTALDIYRQQLGIDHAKAINDLDPALDMLVWGSQDTGQPTSSKQDKSPFEMEASLFLDVPIQRRKARGKIASVEGKLSQVAAKRRMTEDKIGVEVQSAVAALATAYEQYQQAHQAVALAQDLASRERVNFENGLSDLLKVALREQYAVESSEKEVYALLEYYRAAADFQASTGMIDASPFFPH